MTFCKTVLSLAVLLIATAPLALAQGTYTQIDYPGATSTTVSGLDSAGDLVGSYVDAGGTYHGFLLSNDAYATIDYPGARRGTDPSGINDVGQIVGYAPGPSSGYLSFTYDIQTQTFTRLKQIDLNDPYATSINNAGVIVGTDFGASQTVGFELNGATYSRILPPSQAEADVYGISGSGEVVGVAVSYGGTFTNFSYSGGKYKQLTIPNAPGAQVSGINNAGTAVVGYYSPSSCPACSFVYQNQALQLLQFPGSIDTGAVGVNDAGEVVGSFEDASNNTHGFTWTPPAAASRK